MNEQTTKKSNYNYINKIQKGQTTRTTNNEKVV